MLNKLEKDTLIMCEVYFPSNDPDDYTVFFDYRSPYGGLELWFSLCFSRFSLDPSLFVSSTLSRNNRHVKDKESILFCINLLPSPRREQFLGQMHG